MECNFLMTQLIQDGTHERNNMGNENDVQTFARASMLSILPTSANCSLE